MDSVKVLKAVIVAQWVFLILSVVVGIYEEQYLPYPLQLHLYNEAQKDLSLFESVVLAISVIFVFILLFSSVGLYRMRAWSRKPYVITLFLGAVIYPFTDLIVYPPISSAIDYIATLLMGMTVGLIYFSEARNEFKETEK